MEYGRRRDCLNFSASAEEKRPRKVIAPRPFGRNINNGNVAWSFGITTAFIRGLPIRFKQNPQKRKESCDTQITSLSWPQMASIADWFRGLGDVRETNRNRRGGLLLDLGPGLLNQRLYSAEAKVRPLPSSRVVGRPRGSSKLRIKIKLLAGRSVCP